MAIIVLDFKELFILFEFFITNFTGKHFNLFGLNVILSSLTKDRRYSLRKG